ncbi:MAG: hypothetical protein KFB93_08980 [Simkaniaceae bacterium]|jgi:hypothetical protein|nr:MAG: hypothetical protein KFB93_08980 [Simkaniaceae bacterium]
MEEHPFYLQELFKKGPKVTLSDHEIAEFLGISVECEKKHRKSDVKHGFIFEDKESLTCYLSPIGFERVQNLRVRKFSYSTE